MVRSSDLLHNQFFVAELVYTFFVLKVKYIWNLKARRKVLMRSSAAIKKQTYWLRSVEKADLQLL